MHRIVGPTQAAVNQPLLCVRRIPPNAHRPAANDLPNQNRAAPVLRVVQVSRCRGGGR
jgi:hypothetical protein